MAKKDTSPLAMGRQQKGSAVNKKKKKDEEKQKAVAQRKPQSSSVSKMTQQQRQNQKTYGTTQPKLRQRSTSTTSNSYQQRQTNNYLKQNKAQGSRTRVANTAKEMLAERENATQQRSVDPKEARRQESARAMRTAATRFASEDRRTAAQAQKMNMPTAEEQRRSRENMRAAGKAIGNSVRETLSSDNAARMQRQKSGIQTEEDKRFNEERRERRLEIAKNTGRAAKKGVQDTLTGYGKTLADIDEMAKSSDKWTEAKSMKLGIDKDDTAGRAKVEEERQKSIKEARRLRLDLGEKQEKRQKEFDEATKNAKGLEKAWYGAVESGTGMATDMAVGAVTGTGQVGALASMGIRSYGATRGQAEKEGATENEDRLYSLLQAGKEVGTEMMFQGAGLAKSAFSGGKVGLSLADRAANSFTRNMTGRAADATAAGIRLLGGTAEENAEEFAGWLADPVIKELTYGRNVRQREAKAALKEESDAIRANITSEEDARSAAAYLNSDRFVEENTKQYMDAGLSEKQAREVSEQMRDYLAASLSGDTDRMAELEDSIAATMSGRSLKDWLGEFDKGELADTFASTSLLTLTTGLPAGISTAAKGSAIRDSLGTEGLRALSETAINFEDGVASLKAQAARDRMDEGKELTSTQVYDLAQAQAQQVEKDVKRSVAASGVAETRIKDENYVMPELSFGKDGSVAGDEVIAANYVKESNAATDIIEDLMKQEGSESLTDTEVQNGSRAIAGFKTGAFTIADANALNYTNTTVRTAFSEATGIDLNQYVVKDSQGKIDIPKTNAATKDALFAMAADNYVKTAEAETANWMDNTKGEVVTEVTSRMGAQGSVALQAALDDVDERDRSTYMLHANAADMMYQTARNMGTEWDTVKAEAKSMFPGVSEDKLRDMYNAGLRDREAASTRALGKQVKIGETIDLSDEAEAPKGNVYIDTEYSPKGSVVRVFSEIATNLGVDIHLVDDLRTGTGTQANGQYINGAIYININSDFEKNVGYIFMHEVTHHLKLYAPEQFNALENLVRERWFDANADEMENEIAKKIDLYKRNGQTLSEDEALEEIIADAAHEFINDSNFARQAAETDPSLAKAVLDSIRNALRAIRRILALSNLDDETHMNTLFSQLGILDEAERLWLDAYTQAVRNRAAVGIDEWQEEVNVASQVTKVSDNGTILTREDVRHSLSENFPEYNQDKVNLDIAVDAVGSLYDQQISWADYLEGDQDGDQDGETERQQSKPVTLGQLTWSDLDWSEETSGESEDGFSPSMRRNKDNNSGIRTVGRRIPIPEEIIQKGYIDLRGHKVSKPEDLVKLCQVLRNPMFETSRIFYLKGDTIVGHRAVSSHLPMQSAGTYGKGVQYWSEEGKYQKDVMARLGADGYYIMHNHPSGHVEASSADKTVTKNFQQYVPGLKGHIILDHNKFGWITPGGRASEKSIPDFDTDDPLHLPSVENDKLGMVWSGKPDDIAAIGRDIVQSKDGYSVVVYLTSHLEVNELQEINNKVILNDKNFANYIKNENTRAGSGRAIIYTTDLAVQKLSEKLVKTKHFEGVVYEKGPKTILFSAGKDISAWGKTIKQKSDYISGGAKAADNRTWYQEDRTRLSLSDADYMAAVESGDMETAQRMVDEAAARSMPRTKLAGRWYHGTENEFTEFNFSQGGKNGHADGYGIYLTNDPEVASSYGSRMIEGYVNVERPASALTTATLTKSELHRLIKRTVDNEAETLQSEGYDSVDQAKFDTWISNYTDTYYAGNIDKAIDEVIDAITNINGNDYDIVLEIMTGMGIRDYEEASAFYDILTEETGIDGFETKWGDESEMADPNTPTIALAFRSNQIKDASPVTYDNDGNVIPLSERFNMDRGDIRFSISDESRVMYTPKGIEVVKNPTDSEYSSMREEILAEYPWLRGTGEPLLRHTYDESGNEYYWSAFDGMHRDVEPYINRQYNTRTSQQWKWYEKPDKDDYPTDYSAMMTRYSIAEDLDEAYMDAVNSGNMEEAQRLVDEAAKSAEYDISVFHGTTGIFDVFDRDRAGGSNGMSRLGFWFTETQEGAQAWAENSWWGDNNKPHTIGAYIKLKNPKIYETTKADETTDKRLVDLRERRRTLEAENQKLLDKYGRFGTVFDYTMKMQFNNAILRRSNGVVDRDRFDSEEGYQAVSKDIKAFRDTRDRIDAIQEEILKIEHADAYEQLKIDYYHAAGMKTEDALVGGLGMAIPNEREAVEKFREQLKAEGYDGIIIRNTRFDSSIFGGINTQYVVFEPEQVKSADPVTYAEDGSVIPLSQRFDPTNNDIRYSMSTEDADGNILTDGQMEYFKNSMARDEQGRLVPVYHGTFRGPRITVFNETPDGIWFTSDRSIAEDYSMGYEMGIPGAMYGDERNPYDTDDEYFAKKGIRIEQDSNGDWVAAINRNGREHYWGAAETKEELIDSLYESNENEDLFDSQFTLRDVYPVYLNLENPKIIECNGSMHDDVNGTGMTTRELAAEAMAEGYDGIIFRDVVDPFESIDVYVAFSSNQIKDINNENPTENPDIRYSITPEDEGMSKLAYEDAMDDSYEALARYEEMLDDPNAEQYFSRPFKEEDVTKFFDSLRAEDAVPSADPSFEEDRVRRAKSKAEFYNSVNAKWNDRWTTEGEVLDLKSVKKDIKNLVMGVMANSDTDAQYRNKLVRQTLLDVRTAYQLMKQDRTDVASYLLFHSAQRMIEGVEFIQDDTAFQEYKEIRDYLRTYRINAPEEFWENESFLEFRKEYYGRLRIGKGNSNIEDVYKDLEDRWPHLFNETERENADLKDKPWDLLQHIGVVVDSNVTPFMEAYSSEEAMAVITETADALYDIMAGGKEVVSLADSYKQRFDEKTKAMKQRHAEAILRMRKAKEEGIKKERQKFREYKERQKEKKAHSIYFDRIVKTHKALVDRLVSNTADKNIPEQYKKELANLLAAFDLQTVGSKAREKRTGHKAKNTIKLNAIKDTLRKIEGRTQLFHVSDAITDIMDGLSDIEGKTIDELSASELSDIDRMLRSLLHEFNTYRNVKAGAKKRQAADIGAAQVESDLAHAMKYGRGNDYHGFLGALDKLVNMDEMTPAYLFKRIDPNKQGLGLMYGEIRKSLDTYIRNQNQLNGWMEEIVGKYHQKGILWNKYGSGELANWRSTNYKQTFNLTNGTVELTPAQMMSLYCLARRNQAYRHMVGAGIVVAPVSFQAKIMSDIKERANMSLPVILTDADIQTICAALTPEQVNVANQLQELMSTKMADWGNDASMRVLGIELFNERDYFPIKSDKAALEKDLNDQEFVEAIRNFGFTKAVQPGARNAIMVEDIFDVVAEHCNNMNLYNAYSESINDFMKVYNYRHFMEDGSEYTVQQSVAHAYSRKATTFIMSFMRDLNGNVSGRDSGIESLMQSALGNAKKASVFANGRVALQQPTAITRAFAVIDPKYLKGVKVEKGAMQEMFEHCPIALWKSWGYYDINMGRSIEGIMMNNGSWAEDKMTDLYGKLDNVTWTAIWQMVKAEMKDTHPNVEIGSDEYFELCNERMTEIVDLTQVVDSPLHRSHGMRDKSFFMKLSTSFMAEPTLTFNMIKDGYVRSYEAFKAGDKAQAAKIFGRTSSVALIQAAAVASCAAIWDALRGKNPGDDDDDEELSKFRLWWLNTIENFKDETLKPWNKIYIVKDIASIFEGWDNKNLAFQGYTTLAQGLTQMQKKLTKGSKTSWWTINSNIIGGFGYLIGVPFKTVMKDSMSIYKMLGFKSDFVEKMLSEEKTEAVLEIGDGIKPEGLTGKLADFFKEDEEPETTADSVDYSDEDLPDNLTEEQKEEIRKAGERRTKKGVKTSEAANRDMNTMLFDAEKAAAGYEGSERDKKIWSSVSQGYKTHIESGDFGYIAKMRKVVEQTGGDLAYFDEQINKATKSALKKTIEPGGADTESEMVAQQNMRYYLQAHGVSQEEISADICYKSDAAKDLKVAFRLGDEQAILESTYALMWAGITQTDIDRLYKNRNRMDLTKYDGRYKDRLKSTGNFIWPTEGVITSHFGYRNAPTAGASSNHPAIDIGAPQGTAVVAADGGTVIYAGKNSGYGNSVGIKHDNGMVTYYNHLYSWNVKVGDTVGQGQQIAQVGSTGISTGPHLDFKILDTNGEPVDPEMYLQKRQ